MQLIERITARQLRKDLPQFRSGDVVRVHTKIREGDKERVQIFEGIVIRRRMGGITASITVRKHSYGVGVERVFPLHSPMIDRIEVITKGRVRRAVLTYLRKRSGKAARIESEERWENVAQEIGLGESEAGASVSH